jgi:hypothetical protein
MPDLKRGVLVGTAALMLVITLIQPGFGLAVAAMAVRGRQDAGNG